MFACRFLSTFPGDFSAHPRGDVRVFVNQFIHLAGAFLLFACEMCPGIHAQGQATSSSVTRSPFVLESRAQVTSIGSRLRSVSAPASN